LQCDIDIVLKPDPSYSDIEETMNSVHDYLKNQLPLLDKLRKYIAIISTFPFKYDQDILKVSHQILSYCELIQFINPLLFFYLGD